MYEIFARLLEEREITPYQVFKATGVAQSSLSDWKKGKSKPKIDKLKKIANFFEVSVDYLMGEEEYYYIDSKNFILMAINHSDFSLETFIKIAKISKDKMEGYLHGYPIPEIDLLKIAKALNMAPRDMYSEPYKLERHSNKENLKPFFSDEVSEAPSDVSDEINNVLNKLMQQQEGLMFCGKPMDDETKRLLKISLENTMKLAIEMDKNKEIKNG